jgi:hypothetical protein
MGPVGPSFSREGELKIVICAVQICWPNGTNGTMIFSRGRVRHRFMCCTDGTNGTIFFNIISCIVLMGPMGSFFGGIEGEFEIVLCTSLICGTNGTIIFSGGRVQKSCYVVY